MITCWLTYEAERYEVRAFGRPAPVFQANRFWDVGDDVNVIAEELTEGDGTARVYSASPYSGCVVQVDMPTRDAVERLITVIDEDPRLRPDTVQFGRVP